MHIPSLAAAFGAAVLILPASAAAMCAERAVIVAELARDWGEVPRFRGLTAQGYLFELFLSPSGSWSAVATLPNGTACLVGAGADGTDVPPKTPGVPS